MFYDEVSVRFEAGKGGDGCFSFRRAKYEPKGGPNGGNGGRGGDIFLVGDTNVADLTDFHFQPRWRAKNGEPGRGSDQHGANGESLFLRVPLGTVVFDAESGRRAAEILEHGEKLRFLRGGGGGKGNAEFKSSTNQAPREITLGKPGETGDFRLVIKTIADVGLIGFPNAGKSTLLNFLTNAHPKTAAYPFTTLFPSIGVVDYPDRFERITVADIPGLIEGAHANRGLGHRFLKHVERCKVLLLLLDTEGTDGREPVADYRILVEELRLYAPDLVEKPRVVAANKMDEPEAPENLKVLRKEAGEPVLPVSCLSGEGLEELKEALLEQVLGCRAEAGSPREG